MNLRAGLRPLLPCLAFLAFSPSALPADAPIAADLARCVEIAAREIRLACYDKLAGRAPDTMVHPPLVAAAGEAIGARPGTSAQPSSVPAAADDDPRNFGLSRAQVHPTEQAVASIEARIVKLVSGQSGARGYVVLDNGQTWMFTDSDEDQRLRSGDTVTIRRAALGSFALTSSSSKRTYHVHRRK